MVPDCAAGFWPERLHRLQPLTSQLFFLFAIYFLYLLVFSCQYATECRSIVFFFPNSEISKCDIRPWWCV